MRVVLEVMFFDVVIFESVGTVMLTLEVVVFKVVVFEVVRFESMGNVMVALRMEAVVELCVQGVGAIMVRDGRLILVGAEV